MDLGEPSLDYHCPGPCCPMGLFLATILGLGTVKGHSFHVGLRMAMKSLLDR